MNIKNLLSVVDGHTEGQNIRTVIGGLPLLKGRTLWEKREYFKREFDYIRSSLMNEPRGWSGMFGAALTEPCVEEADLAAIFMDPGGYISGCLHGTIGIVTMALELGLVKCNAPEVRVKVETISGLVTALAKVGECGVESVSIENVPAFVHSENVPVKVPGLGEVRVDIAFGGNFFAILPSERVGLKLIPENGNRLVEIGMKITDAVNEQIKIAHPEKPDIRFVDLTEFTGPATPGIADVRQAAICCRGATEGAFDRSPCGTGTCADLALQYQRGKVAEGQVFTTESLFGSLYKARIKGITKVGQFDAILPEVTGRAFVTGFQHFVIDRRDPLGSGWGFPGQVSTCSACNREE